MIYNNSLDPIEIKKIYIRIWSLRDQIENLLYEQLNKKISETNTSEIKTLDPLELKKLIHQNNTRPISSSQEADSSALLPAEKISFGNTLLGDINMNRIAFFSQRPFLIGQSILIEFIVPDQFTLNAEIIYFNNYNRNGRIISKTSPQYRLIAKFTFLREGERTLLRKFVTSFKPLLETSLKHLDSPSETKNKNQDQNQEINLELGGENKGLTEEELKDII